MRYVVTGGAGFIGSHLTDYLLSLGHQVIVLDDLSVGSLNNLSLAQPNPQFHFVQGSILDTDLLNEILSGVDGVFHLAAVVGVRYVVNDPLRGMQVNVTGTENVINAAAQHGCKVVLASSSEVYGKSTAVPFKESDVSILGATSVPRWSYAVSKLLDEHYGFAYHKQQGLPVAAVRYFNIFGPRLDPRGYGSVVAKFISQALAGEPLTVYGDGQQTRSFTYCQDAVRGTAAAMFCEQSAGHVFNIGNPHEITVAELAERICETAGTQSAVMFVPFEQVYGKDFEETLRRLPDISLAQTLLDFNPEVDLATGLRNTIQWFMDRER